jgi:hypothetical protein
MDAYCVDGVSVRRVVCKDEVGLTKKKRPQAKTSKRAASYFNYLTHICRRRPLNLAQIGRYRHQRESND